MKPTTMGTIHVRVLFFGPVAEAAGKRELLMEILNGETISSIVERVLKENPLIAKYDLHVSRNQVFATFQDALHDEDEVAIFTSVSGG